MRFLTLAMAASIAFGQTTRVFHLTQNEDKQEMENIALVIRAIAGIERVSVDDLARSVTAEGTPEQTAMAEWLALQMDAPANGPFGGVREYRAPGARDDVVRVFYVGNAGTPQDLQQIATTVRSVADVRQLFVYNARKVIVARGTVQQIALGAWLVDQLNQPPGQSAPAPHEFRVADDDVARVFELTNAQTAEQCQELVTLIRSVADMQRLILYYGRRAVALRGPAEKVALAAWLVKELDQPADGQAAGSKQEYVLPNDRDNAVRVFYLARSQPAEEYQKAATQIRRATGTGRMYVYNPLGAIAMRGTAEQVAAAERMLKEMQAQ